MFDLFPIQFEQPVWLLLLVLLIPIWLIAFTLGRSLSRSRRWVSSCIRTIVIMLLAMSLARPTWVERSESVTVTVISDASRSIPVSEKIRASGLVQSLLRGSGKLPDDRVAGVTVGATAQPVAHPHSQSIVDLDAFDGDRKATDLAAGLEQALSLLPSDTANRLLLISDGNQTRGNVLEVADIARANGIPIDVIPIRYEFDNEVLIDSLKVPTRARLGQTVDLKVFLRSQKETSGTLAILENDVPLVLDPQSGATQVEVKLPPGPTVLSFPISLDTGGAHRYEAIFTPDVPGSDGLVENNRGTGITFVSGEGRLLLIEGSEGEGASFTRAMVQAGIEIVVRSPEALGDGLAFLNGFDAVVLADVPRWSISNEIDAGLRAYVHDLGGGLLMIGGANSFGAGGWIDSQTAKVLPLRLDPPEERQMVRGALALIMHSTELARANYWGQQTAIAAIEALTSLDYAGIITFNYGAIGPSINGSSWAFPMQIVGNKKSAIAAAKSMSVGDMPDFQSSFELAFSGLDTVPAGQKHVIVISDGDPAQPSQPLIDSFAAAGITVTTIMFEGHGTALHRQTMRAIASYTGGRFYNEPSPKELPKIFNKEASVVSRSLINEGSFQPIVNFSVSGPAKATQDVPEIRGFILTVPREGGLAQVPITIPTTKGEDPLYAYWNHGLGKSIAFTSDLSGRWGSAWTEWSGFQRFWEQSVRWMMRPGSPANILVRTRVDGDRAIVEMDASGETSGFVNFLKTEAKVLLPNSEVNDLDLEQIGPGRYRGEYPLETSGSYLVNIAFPMVGSDGESVIQNIQGAVSVPYAKEFKLIRDNTALLRTIADRTGGRIIELDDPPESVDLFEKIDLEIPLASKRVWDLLAIIAASIFLLDVALRRLSFDARSARSVASRAVSRPNQSSGESVVAWKRARSRSRRGSTERDSSDQVVDGMDQPASSTDFDVDTQRTGGSAPQQATPRREDPANGEGDDSSEDRFSRLKRARRRARGEEDS
jgi:uncharacterized membrane protein/Mg-chelatase subunit ChlD